MKTILFTWQVLCVCVYPVHLLRFLSIRDEHKTTTILVDKITTTKKGGNRSGWAEGINKWRKKTFESLHWYITCKWIERILYGKKFIVQLIQQKKHQNTHTKNNSSLSYWLSLYHISLLAFSHPFSSCFFLFMFSLVSLLSSMQYRKLC